MQSSSSSSSVSAHNRRNKTPDIPQSPGPPPVPTNHDETTEIEGNITANTVMDAYYRILLNDGVIANTVFPDALKAYLTRSEWEHIVIAFASDNITIPQRCCCCTQCYINHGICSHIACFDCCFEVCCDCCDLQQPTSCVGKLRIRCCQHNKCCQEPCLQCAMYCTTFCGCCYAADYFEMLLMRKRLKTESRYLNALLFYNEPVLRIFQNDYITVDMKELLLVYAKKNGLENEDELSSPPVSMLNMKRWVSSSRKKKKQRQQADQAALEEAGGTTLQEYEIVNVSTMEEAVDEEEEEEEFYNFDEIYNQGDFPDDVDTGRPAKNATRRGETSSGKNNTRSKTSPGLGRPVSFSRQMSHKIQGLFGQGSTSSAGVVTSSAADHPELVVHRHLIPNPEVQPQFPSHSIGCPLIVDCGSHTTKAGFATDELPSLVFPTILGSPINPDLIPSQDLRELYIGNDAQTYRSVLSVTSPFVEDGIINNWEQMEGIWGYTFFTKMRLNPSEHPLVLSDTSSATTIATSTVDTARLMTQREKIAQIMFETFQFPALYLAYPEVLALYGAKGSLNGCVLHIGDNVMSTTCVTDGFLSSRDINMSVNGRQLTELTRSSLLYNHQFGGNVPRHQNVLLENQTAFSEFLRQVKEQIGYVALNYEQELRRPPIPTPYKLPDGTILQLGPTNTRYYAAEALFTPARILGSLTGGSMSTGGSNSRGNKSLIGIHGAVYNSIMQHSDTGKTKVLFNHVVLSGGTTMIPGITDRLQHELKALVPFNTNVRIIAPPQRAYTVFQGGAILSSLSTFQHMWISKADYAEYGENIVHKKCQ